MDWTPLSETKLWDLINEAEARMSPPQQRLWEKIRVAPAKWALDPWGNLGGGFWVVALIGNVAIWYNDIEEGFNRSTYSRFGQMDEYWCNQDALEWTVQQVLNEILEGVPSGGYCSPPRPLA